MKSKKFLFVIACLRFFPYQPVFSQSLPQALVPGIVIEHVVNVPPNCSRIAIDPVTHDLYYLNLSGDIHRVIIDSTFVSDEVVFTTADHHIDFLQGFVFKDSLMYLVGDVNPDAEHKHGMVMKGKLKADGSRNWDTVMYTALFPTGSTAFDHGFSGITISPDGKSLYINSGSRTDHGEEQNNGGLFPDTREVPLTSVVFKIGAKKKKLFLPNDSAAIAPYVFADGLRNSFDLAFSPDGHLFGCESSGDRDDPDELNWIQKGKHYGFPWILGGDYNPQQFSGYDPETDVMLSKERYAYKQGFYYNDPDFPPLPAGLKIKKGVQNLGPDADFYRDSATATVFDASENGHKLHSFTPHRTSLGLVFDYEDVLAEPYTGDAFMLGFQRQGDSTGRSDDDKNGTLLDPCEDLLHVELTKTGAKYKMTCTRIVEGFTHPVDAFLDGSVIYVIENSVEDSVAIWKITMPSEQLTRAGYEFPSQSARIIPNPNEGDFILQFSSPASCVIDVTLFDRSGRKVQPPKKFPVVKGNNEIHLTFDSLASGNYFILVEGDGIRFTKQLSLMAPE